MRHRLAIFVLLSASAAAAPAMADDAAIPDFSGHWGRAGLFRFEPPVSGPGPVTNTSRFADTVERVGDYTNPILKPQSADIVRKRGDAQLAGVNFPDPRNQCRPEPPPFILAVEFQVLILQKKDEIDIFHIYGHQRRRIRLNATHPEHVTPSAYGDSIGHYEGDTLIVDTVGIKTGPLSMVDIFGTPHSDALHLTERYRRISGSAAEKVVSRTSTPFGNDFDPDLKKDGFQIEFTVDDPVVFTTPWSARVTYRPLLGEWQEVACAENDGPYFDPSSFPHTDKSDF